jgi:DNA-binding NtrC family response regulator
VVIYAGERKDSGSLGSANLRNTLKQAGVTLQTAANAAELERALKTRKVDVVLADFADLNRISLELRSASSQPVVVPVLLRPSKAELSAAQHDYRLALKAPLNDLHVLAAIQEAMKLRARTSSKS